MCEFSYIFVVKLGLFLYTVHVIGGKSNLVKYLLGVFINPDAF